ncbi:MAG: NAD(P)/FAD-dependent oxidoreductase, partial [Kiritimatiellae bacterium]|nr:NAD(P)/FAD-dependent oxidoreductase [Kiritimatiellia bacterium]
MTLDLAIVGAGPAGLAAALTAARAAPGARIAVFERLPEPARKLAATGGGRGNLSHDASETAFAAAFGPSGRFAIPAFRALPPAVLRDALRRIGLPTVVNPDGRIYPASQSAADLRRALLAAVAGAGIRIVPSTPVSALPPARRVILAAGGQSAPALGSDGSGFSLAASLGHRIVPPVPGLAPILVDDAPWLPPLAGIPLLDATLRLVLPRRP